MSEQRSAAVRRRDHRPPDYRVESAELDFELQEDEALVRARLELRRSSDGGVAPPLVLDGEDLELLEIALDGRPLASARYRIEPGRLLVLDPPARFALQTAVRIHPERNTALSGLYRSGSLFCTQCEATGFRRITYFVDRPDVMARYTTRIRADRKRYPVLLSNGNPIERGISADARHFVVWRDPFPKPSYLFALVAGDLHCESRRFWTRSGRDVRLELWVEHGNRDRCDHALDSLGKAMRWDEERFGLEYDLDVYMIVAVQDFNMGAMENKGLNIFNAKSVLARPETATDEEYERIEGVVAHEYFHNWTGNRVTCRDWFQLTLKEGLTVFRDQEFTSDVTSRAVKRILDVEHLRSVQFPEDAGPMAHPIRPESYVSIDNFYTATVYEKGAEVIRMLQTLLGVAGFRRGLALYLERHDGQAVTCDDFLAAMSEANGVDLEQFGRWYEQAGTPLLEACGRYDPQAATYALELRQSLPREGAEAAPLHIPVAVGLPGPDGGDLPLALEGEQAPACATTRVLELRECSQRFVFRGVPSPPVPSILRGFSAPVRLRMPRARAELAFLMAHDSDAVNRWDAGQQLAKELLLDLVADAAADRSLALDGLFVEAFGRVLADPVLDGSLKALALSLPSERVLGQELEVVDVDAIHRVRRFAVRELARAHEGALARIYEAGSTQEPYRIDRASIDRRRLKNTALRFLAALERPEWTARIAQQFDAADNMTDRQAALALLADVPGPERVQALARFHAAWRHDPLVLDKWFSVQAQSSLPETLDRVLALARHEDFTLRNPNRVRALVGAFCGANQVRFHAADGRGYAFLADCVLELDALNPQLAARMVSHLNLWRRFDLRRRERMRAQLERIHGREGLSRDVQEIVTRAL